MMMKMGAMLECEIRPASAGADHGGEVGGAQQGVLGSAHTAPVINQRICSE